MSKLLKKESKPWGEYRLYLDDYIYYFDTLEEACEHMCKILKALNLIWFYDKGEFLKTKNFKNVWKTKVYSLKITHPQISLKIWYKGKTELLPELVFYYLNKHIKKADT